MSWSYSGNPGSSAKDQVRFLIGDTNTKDQLLLDGEITWLLEQYNQYPLNAAARACELIAAKFSRMCDETVGRVSIDFSQRAKGYYALRDDLVRQISLGSQPFAGGISHAQKQAEESNEDRVKPSFTRHMMQNELAGNELPDTMANGQGSEDVD